MIFRRFRRFIDSSSAIASSAVTHFRKKATFKLFNKLSLTLKSYESSEVQKIDRSILSILAAAVIVVIIIFLSSLSSSSLLSSFSFE